MSNPYGKRKRRSKKKVNGWRDTPYIEEKEQATENIFIGFNSSPLLPARPIRAPPLPYPHPPNVKKEVIEVIDLLSDDSGDTVIMKYSDDDDTKTEGKDLQIFQKLDQNVCNCSNALCDLAHSSVNSMNAVECKDELFSLKNIVKEDPFDTGSDESGDTVIVDFNSCDKLDKSCCSNTNDKSIEISAYGSLTNSNLGFHKQQFTPVEITTQSVSKQSIKPLFQNYGQFNKTQPLSDMSSINSACDYRKQNSSLSQNIIVDNTTHNLQNSNIEPISILIPFKEPVAAYLHTSSDIPAAKEIQPQIIENAKMFIKTEIPVVVLHNTSSHSELDGSCSINVTEHVVDSSYNDIGNKLVSSTNVLSIEQSKLSNLSNLLPVQVSTTYLHTPLPEEAQLMEHSPVFIKNESPIDKLSEYNSRNGSERDCSCSSRVINVIEHAVEQGCITDTNLTSFSNVLSANLTELSNRQTLLHIPTVEESQLKLMRPSCNTDSLTNGTSSINNSCHQRKYDVNDCAQNIIAVANIEAGYNITDNPFTSISSVLPVNSTAFTNQHALLRISSAEGKESHLMERNRLSIKSESLAEEEVHIINNCNNDEKLNDSSQNRNVIEDVVKTTCNVTNNNLTSLSNVIPVNLANLSNQFIPSCMPPVEEHVSQLNKSTQLRIKTEPLTEEILVKSNPVNSRKLDSENINVMEGVVKTGNNITDNTLTSISNLIPLKRPQPSTQQAFHMPTAKKIRAEPSRYDQTFIKTEPLLEEESPVNASCSKFSGSLTESFSVKNPCVMPAVKKEFPVPLHSIKCEFDSSSVPSQLKLATQQMPTQSTVVSVNKYGQHLPNLITTGSSDKGADLSQHKEAAVYVTNEHSILSNSPPSEGLPFLKLSPNMCAANLKPMQNPNAEFSEMSIKFLTLNINFNKEDIDEVISHLKAKYLRDSSSNFRNRSDLIMDEKVRPVPSNKELKDILQKAKSTLSSVSDNQSQPFGDIGSSVQMAAAVGKSTGSSKRQSVENYVLAIHNIKNS